jgi:hypothetical protein
MGFFYNFKFGFKILAIFFHFLGKTSQIYTFEKN